MNKLIIFLIAVAPILFQQTQVGTFADQTDVGNPVRSGYAKYYAATDAYIIEGAGDNIWANRDEFHFVWLRLKGNFILSTNAELSAKESNRTERAVNFFSKSRWLLVFGSVNV